MAPLACRIRLSSQQTLQHLPCSVLSPDSCLSDALHLSPLPQSSSTMNVNRLVNSDGSNGHPPSIPSGQQPPPQARDSTNHGHSFEVPMSLGSYPSAYPLAPSVTPSFPPSPPYAAAAPASPNHQHTMDNLAPVFGLTINQQEEASVFARVSPIDNGLNRIRVR